VKSSLRYLVAGGVNTLFGYIISLVLYYGLHQELNLVIILAIINIISISFSFLIYKIFVFKTQGNWVKEYLRCYLVYGFTAILSSACIWILVEKITLSYWIAQTLAIIVIIIVSYSMHKSYTFKAANEKN
jgi:putative flippase GtrA